ncbi:ABC transporter ATP-binding protein [Eubacteriaceae bacterium ES2]|nr:ABC transporter ATP-binding protein [Eubacteriaceae bacterium ES2]
MKHQIQIDQLTCGYGQKSVLSDMNFTVNSGEILCILGPNGVGKTTLFRTILGFLPEISGTIIINGRRRQDYTRSELAKIIAYVPQAHIPSFSYRVEDIILMGRVTRFKNGSKPGKIDRQIVLEVMERLEISFLKDKLYTNISGGERQMVLIARALAQQPMFLIMDEPTSNLDFGNQIRVLEQVKKLRDQDIGIIMTTHSPDHVFYCSGNVLLISGREKVNHGNVRDILKSQDLSLTFGIDIEVVDIEKRNGDKRQTCVI